MNSNPLCEWPRPEMVLSRLEPTFLSPYGQRGFDGILPLLPSSKVIYQITAGPQLICLLTGPPKPFRDP